MPSCAFLTISNTEGWFIDDDLAHGPLGELGWEVENIAWDHKEDWSRFDLVILRSTWDYQKRLSEFLQVLDEIHQSGAVLLNERYLVDWNINKGYLFDLESKGVETVPAIRCNSPSEEDFESAFRKFGSAQLIIKPLLGANADDTYRISPDSEELKEHACDAFKGRECLIQPFMEQVIKEGEYSLMYFNGTLSHSILKTSAPGDFRVQEEHGGGVLPVSDPEQELLITGENAIKDLPGEPLYARVDLVRTPKDTFAIMELELVEPCMYLRFHPKAAENFAKAIDTTWKRLV